MKILELEQAELMLTMTLLMKNSFIIKMMGLTLIERDSLEDEEMDDEQISSERRMTDNRNNKNSYNSYILEQFKQYHSVTKRKKLSQSTGI